MDVGLCIFWWLKLDNQTDSLDIKSSGSNIRGDKYIELSLLKSLDGGLSLVLRDTSMHDLDIFLEGVSLAEHVGVFPRGSEDYNLSTFAIAGD